jgi:hypothetical protein
VATDNLDKIQDEFRQAGEDRTQRRFEKEVRKIT